MTPTTLEKDHSLCTKITNSTTYYLDLSFLAVFLTRCPECQSLGQKKKYIIWTCMDVENFRFFHFEIVYGKVDDAQ